MAQYEPKLPDGVSLPPGFKVDVTDPRYVALHSLAERERLSQSAFSQILGVEAQRVNGEYERARSTPAPAPTPSPASSGVPAGWDKMTTHQQMQHALERSAAKRRGS